MEWSPEAETAISRVPFFVRKRVRAGIEEEAKRTGAKQVRLEHVRASQKRFLERMQDEVQGYQVETCFGPGGCPNRAVRNDELAEKISETLRKRNIKSFLSERVEGPLKMHHEFRVSVSDCPNACSRPQIADLGLIGASRPKVSKKRCTECGACVQVCREDAIHLEGEGEGPVIDQNKCLSCGQCISICPTKTLEEEARGYRIMVGGRLGRHPQLGREMAGLYSMEEALDFVDKCLDVYQQNNQNGERFRDTLKRTGLDVLG